MYTEAFERKETEKAQFVAPQRRHSSRSCRTGSVVNVQLRRNASFRQGAPVRAIHPSA